MGFTINDVMNVEGDIEVAVRGRKRKYYLRTVSLKGDELRSDHARSEARAVMHRLDDPKCEEYTRYMAEILHLERGELIELLRPYKQNEFIIRAAQEVQALDSPEPPNHPTISDIVEIDDANEAIKDALQRDRQAWVTEQLGIWDKEALKRDLKTLRDEAAKARREAIARKTYVDAFNDATLYEAVFTDDRYAIRLFGSIAQAGNCDAALYQQLLAGYAQADRFSEATDELKN